jgi:hypothetical protein
MTQAPPRRISLGFGFRALRRRNCRLFCVGAANALIGTWITRVAIGCLVYRLRGLCLPKSSSGLAGAADGGRRESASDERATPRPIAKGSESEVSAEPARRSRVPWIRGVRE